MFRAVPRLLSTGSGVAAQVTRLSGVAGAGAGASAGVGEGVAESVSAAMGGWTGLGRLNHVAIAVPDLEASITLFRDVLGAEVSDPMPQVDHGVYTVFIDLPGGGTQLELVHPLGDASPVTNFLTKNPAGGIHHVCFEVNDIAAAVEEITEKGIRVLNPEPKIGAHGHPVVFLHPRDTNGILVEFEQIHSTPS